MLLGRQDDELRCTLPTAEALQAVALVGGGGMTVLCLSYLEDRRVVGAEDGHFYYLNSLRLNPLLVVLTHETLTLRCMHVRKHKMATPCCLITLCCMSHLNGSMSPCRGIQIRSCPQDGLKFDATLSL